MIAFASARLRLAGFEVLNVTRYTINIAGPPDLYKTAFQCDLVEDEVALPNGGSSTHLKVPQTDTPRLVPVACTPFEDILEGVALEVPRSCVAASALPPPASYWHLRMPGDVALGLNALPLHRLGITGRGIRIAMVDTGWFRHPHFDAYNYNVSPVVLGPAATFPDVDETGHGTGVSSNVFAVAPDCELIPVKFHRENTLGAFNAAVSLRPHIISCSWTAHRPFALDGIDMALEASVSEAVANGIIVIFAAGNGHAGFPGQHPDVISAGGVFMDPSGNLQAASFASGFQSQIYPGRRIPDVCGLVGNVPDRYIMMPVQPGSTIDSGQAGAVVDETAPDTAGPHSAEPRQRRRSWLAWLH